MIITGSIGVIITGRIGLIITGSIGVIIKGSIGVIITGSIGVIITGSIGVIIKGSIGVIITGSIGVIITGSIGVTGADIVSVFPCRRKFHADDDRAIIGFLLQDYRYEVLGGNVVWKEMEDDKVSRRLPNLHTS